MRFISLSVILLLPFFLSAQAKHDYVWLFGYRETWPPHPELGASIINFNDSIEITREEIFASFSRTNVSYCNEYGELKMYSNGCSVFNEEHDVMLNGSGLNPGFAYDISCAEDANTGGGYRISQSILALPNPVESFINVNLVHINYDTTGSISVNGENILTTSIKFQQENNSGLVIEKNIEIVKDTFVGGSFSATKHANGNDWWVFSAKTFSQLYYTFRLSKEGIEEAFYQEASGYISRDGSSAGWTNFSPNGTKFVRYNPVDGLWLYDFDRETGLLNNFQELTAELDTIPVSILGSCAFSPNSRFLYVNNENSIVQFDLEAEDIEASQVLVAEYDGFLEWDFFPANFYRMQQGPDCRIYINASAASHYLHVIHNPDEKGLACNIELRGIELPTWNARSIPHFPNYRLGGYDNPIDVPFCDSLIAFPPQIVSTVDQTKRIRPMELYPNPTNGELNIALPEPIAKGDLYIFDTLGRLVFSQNIENSTAVMNILVRDLSSGFYQLVIRDNKQNRTLRARFIKQ